MNKPLTKEEREECRIARQNDSLLDRALKAEAYWREALKNCNPVVVLVEANVYICRACNGRVSSSEFGKLHKPDCSWDLAQSE